jgi:hypothetical protein
MRKIFLIFFIFLLVGELVFASEFVYDINLINKNKTLVLENISIGYSKDLFDDFLYGDYTFEVLSYSGEKLYLGTFETKGYAIFEGDLGEGFFDSKYLFYNLTKINFKVPYYKNAKKIIIYDESLNEILEIDVSMYSKNVPTDYSYKENTQNQEINKENEIILEETSEENKYFKEKIAEKWWILVIILLVLLIILVKSFSSKKNPKKHLYN